MSQPENRVPVLFTNEAAPVIDKAVHGLFPEDLEEGIICQICAVSAAYPSQLTGEPSRYDEVVLRVHGVNVKK